MLVDGRSGHQNPVRLSPLDYQISTRQGHGHVPAGKALAHGAYGSSAGGRTAGSGQTGATLPGAKDQVLA